MAPPWEIVVLAGAGGRRAWELFQRGTPLYEYRLRRCDANAAQCRPFFFHLLFAAVALSRRLVGGHMASFARTLIADPV